MPRGKKEPFKTDKIVTDDKEKELDQETVLPEDEKKVEGEGDKLPKEADQEPEFFDDEKEKNLVQAYIDGDKDAIRNVIRKEIVKQFQDQQD